MEFLYKEQYHDINKNCINCTNNLIKNHNTQRPSGNVIPADLKNNIGMFTLLGGFESASSTLIFDEDISDLSKPEIKGRGFIKNNNKIIEYQSFWVDDFRFKYKELSVAGEKQKPVIQEDIVEEFENDPISKISTSEDKSEEFESDELSKFIESEDEVEEIKVEISENINNNEVVEEGSYEEKREELRTRLKEKIAENENTKQNLKLNISINNNKNKNDTNLHISIGKKV